MPSKKRGQNEGTIYQRQDGRWCATITLGYVQGKRKRKSYYGATKAEVHKQLVEGQRNHHLGLNVAPQRQTVGQYLDRWFEDVVKPRSRPGTVRSYEQLIRLHIVPGLGKHELSKLSPQHVQAFLNERHRSGLSARTVQYLRAVLRSALNQALKWDLVVRNVATLATPPRGERHEIAVLDTGGARAFLEAAQGHRHEALFTVAVAIGLRLGEALGLRWEDVDLADASIAVRKQLQRVDGKLQLVEPKTSKARRTIPLPPFAVTTLKAHRARQVEERLLAGPERWQESGYVFTSEIGTPADPRNVRRTLAALLAKADLPPMRFHDLRHTCASLLLAKNVHPRVVMETLGHSQIALTMNTYSHVVPALQRQAADMMQSVWEASA